MKLRAGDTVRILAGRHQDQLGLLTELGDGRATVQIEGLSYERSYPLSELEFKAKAKRPKPAFVMNDDETCPSFPYSCTGACGSK
jgi:hypothetical protein